jgi:hypothetical protein
LNGSEANNADNRLALVTKCAPQITFYAAGATAMKGAIQKVLGGSTSSPVLDSVVFDLNRPFASIGLNGSKDQYAYYGYTKGANPQRLAVIVNGTNGSMAGVIQLISKLKAGTVEGTDKKEEFKSVIKFLSKADDKAASSIPDTDLVAYDAANSAFSSAPTYTFASTRVTDAAKGLGKLGEKVAHMAFSDVRPSEATPGQIAKWDPKAFPSETIAMQGFGVLVNANMYKALQARDIAAGRMASACQDDLLTAACQPNIFTVDYTGLITGKTSTIAGLGLTGTSVLTLNRRPSSSGTQAATQIRFAGQENYIGKTPLNTGFNMVGSETADTTGLTNGDIVVKTHSGTSGLISEVRTGSGLQIGIASLDNGADKKLGGDGVTAVTRANQEAFWVKLDGVSPDFKGNGTTDSKYRTALINGYSFAFEFQTLKDAKLADPYLAIYNAIVDGLKNPAIDLTGIAYIGSNDTTKNTLFTRGAKAGENGVISGGNSYFPLNKY